MAQQAHPEARPVATAEEPTIGALVHDLAQEIPQLVRSVSVEGDGTIEFYLDRGAVIVALIGRDGFDSLLLQRIPDDLWRSARAYAEGNITTGELLQSIPASSKRR